jgi:hypothetical protein
MQEQQWRGREVWHLNFEGSRHWDLRIRNGTRCSNSLLMLFRKKDKSLKIFDLSTVRFLDLNVNPCSGWSSIYSTIQFFGHICFLAIWKVIPFHLPFPVVFLSHSFILYYLTFFHFSPSWVIHRHLHLILRVSHKIHKLLNIQSSQTFWSSRRRMQIFILSHSVCFPTIPCDFAPVFFAIA